MALQQEWYLLNINTIFVYPHKVPDIIFIKAIYDAIYICVFVIF